MNTYYKILNEIASVFDMDQWDEQVNLFIDVIEEQLNPFVYNTEYNWIYILENDDIHDFPQFNFYKERCYVNSEKVELDIFGKIENKWKDQETVNVIIKDLDQLRGSCAYMFFDCNSLISVPKFNTNNVDNMENMFCGCGSLKTVPLFNIINVTNMQYMFYGCKSLSEETKQEWNSIYNFETNNMK